MCSPAEHQSVDIIIDSGAVVAGTLDLRVVQGKVVWKRGHFNCYMNNSWFDPSFHLFFLGLYTKGLIYLDVPISGDDYIVGEFMYS